MTPLNPRSAPLSVLTAIPLLLLMGCQTPPRVSSQTAPSADLSQYHTYAFMEKLSSDKAGYTSITTQLLKQAVSRELAARGFTPSANPDLLVNFIAKGKDKVEGDRDPRIGVSYGHWIWGRRGWGGGLGVGIGGDEIRSVREDTIAVDLVEKSRNILVWSGTATFEPTEKEKNDESPRINDVVRRIFKRYPSAASPAPTAQ